MSHHRFEVLVATLEGMIEKNCMAASSLEEALNRARRELCRSYRAVPQLSLLRECKYFAGTRNVHHFTQSARSRWTTVLEGATPRAATTAILQIKT